MGWESVCLYVLLIIIILVESISLLHRLELVLVVRDVLGGLGALPPPAGGGALPLALATPLATAYKRSNNNLNHTCSLCGNSKLLIDAPLALPPSPAMLLALDPDAPDSTVSPVSSRFTPPPAMPPPPPPPPRLDVSPWLEEGALLSSPPSAPTTEGAALPPAGERGGKDLESR